VQSPVFFFAGAAYNSPMMTNETVSVLFGLAGLANPFALLIGGGLGWFADARAKLVIAGFAASALSVLLDAAMNFSGIAPVGGYEGGPLAVMPFRFVGGLLAAGLVYGLRRRTRGRR
jgi:hypothetical protein